MQRQRSAVGAPPPGPLVIPDGIGSLLAGVFFRFLLLGLFQSQQQLILGQAVCPSPKAMALQLVDDLAQPFVRGALGQKYLTKRGRIAGKGLLRVIHDPDMPAA